MLGGLLQCRSAAYSWQVCCMVPAASHPVLLSTVALSFCLHSPSDCSLCLLHFASLHFMCFAGSLAHDSTQCLAFHKSELFSLRSD